MQSQRRAKRSLQAGQRARLPVKIKAVVIWRCGQNSAAVRHRLMLPHYLPSLDLLAGSVDYSATSRRHLMMDQILYWHNKMERCATAGCFVPTGNRATHVFCSILQGLVHPSVFRVGLQTANATIVGSNARCVAMLCCFQQVRSAHAAGVLAYYGDNRHA